jgi:DNA-binding transcriptional LysR family regulator
MRMIYHYQAGVNFIFFMLLITFTYDYKKGIKFTFDLILPAQGKGTVSLEDSLINFNQLRVFYHAAKHLNFTRGAKELCITQPAVTAQIKLLEESCTFKLFKKRGRKLHLTDEGKTLYRYAENVFEYEKDIEDAIEGMRKLKTGTLRLGTTKTYARYFMPFLVGRFREAYPQVKIHLDEGSSRDMSRSLLDFRNEVAIVARAEDHPSVRFTPFSREEVALILSPRHPFSQKSGVGVRELASEPIIMKETGSGTRKLVNELFAKYGVSPNVLMETSNTEFIKELVQQGAGLSFLVREAVAAEVQAGKLVTVPIQKETMLLDVSIAQLKDQHLSPPAKAFLHVLGRLATEEMTPMGIGALMARMLAQRKRGK